MAGGILLIALGFLSVGLNLWQWVAGLLFPIRRTETCKEFSPAISVLKPLKGCDAETESCLESWFQQEYAGEWELLFAVASLQDPVCAIVRRLQEKYAGVRAELIIADPVLGPNAKVSSLCYLSRRARHDHLVISDADVFVKKDFLSQVIGGMNDETVGLVNCFYILAEPRNAAMRLEAIAVNADFWTQVLQGLTLRKMDFALGAVMVTRRSELAKIGGFEALLEHLADDYELGNRISKLGRRLVISDVPVECRNAEQTAVAVWRHQLRWARTIRVCQPLGYFFSILSNGTVWPVLALASGTTLGRWTCGTGLVLRMLGAVSNYRRVTGKMKWWVAPLAPVKDLASAVLWLLSFGGNQITWHGERFRVCRGGKLTPLA
jgi:ceramide glucosyltransferase